MSNIELNIVAVSNFAALEGELARLRAQIEQTNRAMASVGAMATTSQIHQLSSAFESAMVQSGRFTGTTVKLTSAAEQLGIRVARNKTTFSDFKAALGGLNKETNLYNQLGRRQLAMQQSIVQNLGGGKAKVWTAHAADLSTAASKAYAYNQALMAANATLKAQATTMINWGKNMQWTGRQLTYGITAPIMLLGAGSAKLFYDVNKNLTRLARVYGVGMETASQATIDNIKSQIMSLSNELSKSLGIAASETTDIAAELAAAGQTGAQLIEDTKQAARIVVLGETDKQEAIKATIALQTAYRLNTQELTDSVNFFNAAQAATSTSMADLVEAVPRVGPVIKGLGGSYKDMVSILTAMKEGGVPAAEAANAIKTSLGRLINPTREASDTLKGFGIDIENIVNSNEGNLTGMLTELQHQLDGLTSLDRQRAISELFGKFQFARMTSLMDNFNRSGTQSAKVVDMMALSSQELAQIAEEQTRKIQESASGSFKIAIESLKTSLIPIGEMFLEVFTKIIEAVRPLIEWFNNLSDGAKGFVKFLLLGASAIGPIVMIGGLLGNLVGILLKGAVNAKIFFGAMFRLQNPFKALTSQYSNLTAETLAAENASSIMSKAMQEAKGNTEAATIAIERQITALKELIATMGLLNPAGANSAANVAAARSAAAVAATQSIVPVVPGKGATQLSHLYPQGTPGGISYLEGAMFASGSAQSIAQMNAQNISQAIVPSLDAATKERLYMEMRNRPGMSPENAVHATNAASLLSQHVNQNARAMTIGRLADADWYKQYHAAPTDAARQAQVAQLLATKQAQQIHGAMVNDLEQAYMKEYARTGSATKATEAYSKMARQIFDQQVIKPITAAANGLTNGKPITEDQVRANLSNVAAKDLRGTNGQSKVAGLSNGEVRVHSALLTAAAMDNEQAILASQERILGATEQRYVMSQELAKIEGQVVKARNLEAKIANRITTIEEEIAANAQARLAASQAVGNATRNVSPTGKVTWMKQDGTAYAASTARQKEAAYQAAMDKELAQATAQLTAETEKLARTRATIDSAESRLGTAEQAAMQRMTAEMDRHRLTIEERSRLMSALTMDQVASTERIILAENEQGQSVMRLVDANNVLISEVLQEAGAHRKATQEVQKQTMMQRMGKYANRAGMGLMGVGMLSTLAMNGENQSKGMAVASDIMGGVTMGAGAGMMFGGPWGALIGSALGGAATAAQAYQRAQQEVNDKLVAYGEALNGSSVVINQFADELGIMKPSEKLAAAIGKVTAPEKVMAQADQLLNTNAGKQLVETAKNYGGPELKSMLLSQLKQLTLMEIFTPDQAKAVAQSLAIELGDPMLGQSLVEGINSVLGPDGKLAGNVSQKFIDTIPKKIDMPKINFDNVDQQWSELDMSFADRMKSAGEALIMDFMDLQGGMLNIISGKGFNPLNAFNGSNEYAVEVKDIAEQMAQKTVPQITSSLDKLAQAQAMVTQSFMNGEINFNEYSAQMSQVQGSVKNASEAFAELEKNGADVGALMKDIADKSGRGEEYVQIQDMAKGIQETLGLTTNEFLDSARAAAAYGNITVGQLQTISDMMNNEADKANLSKIFNMSGASSQASEIIKILNMGFSTDWLSNFMGGYKDAYEGLNNIYALVTSIAKLPPEVQKTVIAKVESDPAAMNTLIADYEHVMSLPNTKKALYTEVFGNDELKVLQDHWEEFIALPDEERKTAIMQVLQTGSYTFAPQTPVMPNAPTNLDASSSVQDLVAAATDGGSGGGGSGGGGDSGPSPAEKALDRQIKQEEKLIENINKEREARQKVLDVQKQALDFAMREQDLKNQIAIARASGNTAQAALLQGQLDAARSENQQSLAEKARQEEEDRKIKAAEKRKADLEKQKEKLSKASSGGSSGGGGGGTDEAAAQKLALRLQYLNDKLTASLNGNSQLVDEINQKGGSAFWDSKPIQEYIKEATAAGVPLSAVKKQLEGIYDQMLNEGFKDIPMFKSLSQDLQDVGVAGASLQQVLPNIYGILRDPKIGRGEANDLIIKQFMQIGMKAGEAEAAAKKLLNGKYTVGGSMYDALDTLDNALEQTKDDFNPEIWSKISDDMAQGVRNGLSRGQVLDNISKDIYKATYDNGIAAGLDPIQATKSAESMSDAVRSKVDEKFDNYFKTITFKTTMDYGGVPEWLKKEMDGSSGGMTADNMEHRIEFHGSVDMNLPVGSSASNPMWVQTVNGSALGGPVGNSSLNNGYSLPSSVTRAFGGIIRGYSSGGGAIYGPGTKTSDSILTWLSNGEFVMRAAAVDRYGLDFMNAVNSGLLPKTSKYPGMLNGLAKGGMPSMNYASGGMAHNSNVEYNINIEVAGTNASADDIACTVMDAIQRRDKMNGTRIRI